MKKSSLFLAILLTFSLLCGCGKQNSPTETTVPVTTTEPAALPSTIPITMPTEPSAPRVIHFQLEQPQGFELSVVQDNLQVFSSPKSPRDHSYISIEVFPVDQSVLTMSTEQMMDRIVHFGAAEPLSSENTNPSISMAPEETTEPEQAPEPFIKELNPTTVDEWDAVMVDYVQSYDDYSNRIYRYEVVTTDANYVFSFCDSTDDNEWLDAYEEAADTIDLILDTEGMELDYSNLTQYAMPSGLNIYAEPGLEVRNAPGFTGVLANRNVLILSMADDKHSNNLTGMTLEDYANLVAESNDLEPFQKDMYGNLITTFYSTDKADLSYYNMICVKETSKDFWVFQMACLANDQVTYAKDFSLWASSIA